MTKAERELIKNLYKNNTLLEQLYKNVMDEERRESQVKAGSVELGDSIVIEDGEGKETWTAIAHTDEGTMFLLDSEYEIKNVKFGVNNNYIGSNAQKVATTCNPVKRIESALGSDAFVPLEIDLFSHDGLSDYGVCEGDNFGILTYDVYRNNKRYIKLGNTAFWMSTPDSTHSGYSTSYVQVVYSRGRVNYGNCGWNDCSVRPFCIIKPSVFVSLEQK